MKLVQRIHTWAADNFEWVQYPNIKPGKAAEAHWFAWNYQMPLFKRIELLTVSLSLLFVSLLMIFAISLIGWAFISAALGL